MREFLSQRVDAQGDTLGHTLAYLAVLGIVAAVLYGIGWFALNLWWAWRGE